MEIIVVIAGLFVGFAILLLSAVGVLAAAPLLKSALLDNPDEPDKLALFTSPEPGHAVTIMRGGAVDRTIHGRAVDEPVEENERFKNSFLRAYDQYVSWFGLRLIGIPGIHQVKSYPLLGRYRKTEEAGKHIYTAVKQGDDGYRSNHVRTRLTPWFFLLKGVDIEGIPFTVQGAAQIYFEKDRVKDALFGVDSWSTLLSQALNSTVRGTLREKVSLDDAIGGISQDIWKERVGNATLTENEIQDAILESILGYKLKNGKTLKEAIGLVVEKCEILDFSPEGLSPEQEAQLRAPALERRLAQGRVMAGKAEATYQDEVLAVLAKHPELAKANVAAEAFVKAAQAGQLDALVAGLLKKMSL